jgi:succinoglycan biosynthesis transport protein ExoP
VPKNNRSRRLPAPAHLASAPPAKEMELWAGNAVAWQAADEGPNWRRHAAALVRHKWLILLVTALGTLAGLGVGALMAPTYRAEATIWIESGGRRVSELSPIGSERLLDESAWLDLLQSYAVLDHVVRDLRLYTWPKDPADTTVLARLTVAESYQPGGYLLRVDEAGHGYTLHDDGGRMVEGGIVGDSIGRTVGLQWQPPEGRLSPGTEVAFTVLSVRDAATGLRQGLDPQIDPEGSFITLSLSGANPHRITRVVNAVAQQYVMVAERLKREKHTELTRILGEQLANAEDQLARAEAELIRFRREAALPVAASEESTEPLVNEYLETRVSREQARRDRGAIESVLAGGGEGGPALGALEMLEAVQNSSILTAALDELTEKRAALRALESRYTDAHPAVQRATEEVRRLVEETIPRLARELARQLGERERALDGWVQSADADLRDIPPQRVEARRLDRQVDLAAELYTHVKRRFDETRLAEASSLADVSILDEAMVPRRPVENRGPQIVLFAFVGSLGSAMFGVMLFGRFDRRVHFPDQVSHDMGIPILGAIPHVGGRQKSLQPHEMAEHVEALRGIRLNLVHAYGAPPPLMFTITSPGSGDGKSFVASRLALAFADAGYRTLLIDGDVRRGRLHYTLGRRRRPGLIDHLEGAAEVPEIVQSTGFGPLDFVACGRRSKGGPEHLSSQALRNLIQTLRTQYEVILLDSAPMAAAVDPFVLGTATGNLVLVLRSGVTNGELASAKLDMLDRLPVRLVGAILNDVRRGQGYELYSYYLPGYEPEEEGDAPPRGLPLRR